MKTLFLIFLFIVLYSYLYFRKQRRRNANFPSPPGHFLFGNILEFRNPSKFLTTVTKISKNYGPIVKIKIGLFHHALLTTDYKFSELILNSKQVKKSINYHFLKPWIGNSLLLNEGIEWKTSRKLLTPLFHNDMLKNYVGVFESVGDIFVEKLRSHNHFENLNLYPLVNLCALDIISETVMGIQINAQNGDYGYYTASAQEMCRIVLERSFSIFKLKNWSFVFTKDYLLQQKVVKVLHEFTSSIIAAKREIHVDKTEDRKLVFLDLLHKFKNENGEKWSDEKIREEVDAFIFAGHDTTSSAICFTLYLLANYPEIQNNVLREQKDFFDDEKNPLVTYQHLQRMKYLDKVIKESLRLYSPVPFIGKLTTKDLKFEDKTISSNTNVGLFIYGIHRNPEYFQEPEKFNPDRFDFFDSSVPFLPFGVGPRICIGKKFALLEMKSVIGKVIRHFELKPAFPKHELNLTTDLVLKSKNGFKIGLKERF